MTIHITQKSNDTSKVITEPIAVTIAQAAAMLTLSERTVRSLVKSGELPHRRVGWRVLISAKALKAFIESEATDACE